MTPHLILTLEAPAMSFGGEAIDNRGVVRDFPARSMLTGLIANALGWDRTEGDRLDALQAQIEFASVRLRDGRRRQDYQTARLFERDAGWTTRGSPEGRASSPSFTWDRDWEAARGIRAKSLTHQRFRDFDADALVLVALSLAGEDDPDLDAVARALARPERPLFLGRKPSLPSGPICDPVRIAAPTPVDALFHRIASMGWQGAARASWAPSPEDAPGRSRHLGRTDGGPSGVEAITLRGTIATERRARAADERRHRTGVHGGSREIAEGLLTVAADT